MASTILIADDEPHILALLRAALRGLDTLEASDGDTALAMIREHKPAVVVIDAGMPGLDGYEVTQAVRADGGEQPHILMLTAAGRDVDRALATQAGVDEFITKPFSPSALRRRVEELASA